MTASFLPWSRSLPAVALGSLGLLMGGSEAVTSAMRPQAAEEPVLRAGVEVVGFLRGLDGMPLDGVSLKLRHANPTDLFPRASKEPRQEIRTDGEGRFSFAATLGTGKLYRLRWGSGEVERGASGWLSDEELGSELALTAIALRPFQGRLMEADGAPIVDAEVRVRRSGESVVTNDRGEFRLARVTEVPEPVLFRRPDGQFDWALLKSSRTWEHVAIGAQSKEPFTEQAVALQESELRSLATNLRGLQLDLAIESGDYIEVRWCLLDYADWDLDAALKRLKSPDLDAMFAKATRDSFHDSASCGPCTLYDSVVKDGVDLRKYVAAQLRLCADKEDEEARAAFDELVTGPVPGVMLGLRLRPLRNAVGRNASERSASDPVESARRSVIEAATLRPYDRVRSYCSAALRLRSAGQQEEARAAIELARAIVVPGETPSFLSDDYIQALGAFELEMALELLREHRSGRDRYSGFLKLAQRLIGESPELAVKVLREAEAIPRSKYGGTRSPLQRQRVIYHLGTVSPEEAAPLARKYDPTGYSLGLVALSISRASDGAACPANSAKIRQLLQEAFAVAKTIKVKKRRSESTISLLAVAREVGDARFQHWLGEALWMTGIDDSSDRVDPVIAWNMREHEPALAEAIAFASVRGITCRSSFASNAWRVASSMDPEKAATMAADEHGTGLAKTASALEFTLKGRARYRPTCTGYLWPR